MELTKRIKLLFEYGLCLHERYKSKYNTEPLDSKFALDMVYKEANYLYEIDNFSDEEIYFIESYEVLILGIKTEYYNGTETI